MAAKSASTLAFGRALHTFRIRRGMSQEEAALTCGIARSFFGRVERGETSPTYETVLKLSNGLEITAAELVALAERYEHEDTAPPGDS